MKQSKAIRKDSKVVIISGSFKPDPEDRGDPGKIEHAVLAVDRVRNRVTVRGINVRKIARKPTQDNPQGGFDERECPIHISNVMEVGRYWTKRGGRPEDDDE